jgi:molecular chaperone DnaK
MGRIIGIDLGTTNSVVAVMEGAEPKVITNEEGGRITPSVVGFTATGDTLVGDVARRQAVMNPQATIHSIKRFMGRRFMDVSGELKRVPYEVVEADSGDAAVRVHNKTLTAPEVSAKILQKLKRAAEHYLGEPVTEAVITVPAYFNDAQRKATRDAGQIAGLDVKRIINEPTAAALGYGLNRGGKEELIAVYDLGGGTFDISLLEIGGDVVEVLSTNGDTRLGGDDIDHRIVAFLIEQFEAVNPVQLGGDKMVMQRLREAAEKAKIELSSVMESDVNLPFLTAGAAGPLHLNVSLTRAKLEFMVEDLIARSLKACQRALDDANKKISDIQQVVLVGGSTRMPYVQKKVAEFFGREPSRGVNPDEVVALGAAVQGGILRGEVKDLLLLDVTPLSVGVETQGGVMTALIPRNTTIPTSKTRQFSTVVDNQKAVTIHVCQGEREFVSDNRSLGRFELGNIPNAPRAVPQIEVRFDIDANGILNVSAKEKTTGQEASISITGGGGLSKEEIQHAIADAEQAETQDRAKRRVVERRNKLSGVILSLRRALIEGEALLSGEEQEATNAELANASALEALASATEEALDASVSALAERLRLTTERLQAKASAAAAAAAPPADAPSPEASETPT